MISGKWFKTLFLLLGFLVFCATTPWVAIHGKVVEVQGSKAKIAYEGEYAPRLGDKVSIGFKIGSDFAPVEGEWKIVEVGPDFVWAQAKGPGAGTPGPEYLAVIETRSPQKRSDLNLAQEKEKRDPNVIPGLNARVVGLRFYESGKGIPAYGQREYQGRFPSSKARYINWELSLEHPKPGRKIDFKLTAIYYAPDGTVLMKHQLDTYLDVDWTTSNHSWGWGWEAPGNWKPGEYRADIYMEDKKIASGSFRIY